MPATGFAALGLSAALLRGLAAARLETPTPIQSRAIPEALAGRDILGLARTGTGKTLAFGLPILHALAASGARPAPKSARALVLAPTRELVSQIADSLRPLARAQSLRLTSVVGGQSLFKQETALRGGTDLLVATPGRLIDLIERGAVDLGPVRHLVLDEADQMLDLGFIHALRRIARHLGRPRQTLLFSATMPGKMEEISATYLTDPVRIEVSPPGQTAERVTQAVHFLDKADKPARLRALLEAANGAPTLVFARTKHGAERLMKGLVAQGFAAASIHGNKSQSQRERALSAFRGGAVRVLVATDVAARGIDIPGVALVVNYDLPDVAEAYVHRIGRTARAGRAGRAVAFCTPEETDQLAAIEALTGTALETEAGTRPRPARRPEPAPKGRALRRARPQRARSPGSSGTEPAARSMSDLVASLEPTANKPPRRRRRKPAA